MAPGGGSVEATNSTKRPDESYRIIALVIQPRAEPHLSYLISADVDLC